MTDNANLYAHFHQHFPTDRSTQLLVTAEGRQVSYSEAEQIAARMANCLLKLGVTAGDRITVQVTKSVENLCVYLACLRAGLVYHPLNTAYTAAELAYFIENAEPSIVICDTSALSTMQSVVPAKGVKALLTLDADGSGSLMDLARVERDVAAIATCKGTEMAALLYSSGTTGKPKGIMLSHDNLRHNAQTLVQAWGFTASDHLLHMLPIYHVHGLFVAVSCVLMSGASMAWHTGFNDKIALAALPECTVMMGVPTYYTRLLNNAEFEPASCTNMRLFVCGSAPLLAETFLEFQTRTGHTILERYGMTETGMNTSNPLNGERRAGTVGPALPGVNVRIVDDEGHQLGVDDIGNIQVQGPNVFSGYWRMPDKTAQDFTADGFFNTGDKGLIDARGYISIVGRAKDLIICGGLNVYPKEVELVIDELSGVLETAVIGVAHADFGEAVVAIIVADGLAPSGEAIIAHCKRQLANFKVPKRVEFVDALPRNGMGKVQKNVLRAQFSRLSS